MIDPVTSMYRVPFDGSFRVADAPCLPDRSERGKKHNQPLRKAANKRMRDLQRMLYADNRYSLLLVFQAMDAAGKDSTIRAVMSGINPAGCQVSSFKAPSDNELDHDFLWRIYRALPERGRIGIFNRSHYEEVLVVRVHPEYLPGQRLPASPAEPDELWEQRYESIRNFEQHLARNGTVILKFWLNVSRDEQRKRFLDRIDEPESNWKFSAGDVRERGFWDQYMTAYEDALNATSRPWAPWFSIPADNKPYMRRRVAEIVCETLENLELEYPDVGEAERARMLELREALLED